MSTETPVAKTPTEIRITDKYTVASVEAERIRRGDKSLTATAARLITERLVELDREPVDATKQSAA